jgi:plasmid stabilization system protein ParE
MNAVFAPRALRDVMEIDAYLNDRSPSGALRVGAAIKSSIEALEAFPEIGQTVDEAQHRRLPVFNFPYVIFYRIAGNEVLILHIRHTSRRPIDPAEL